MILHVLKTDWRRLWIAIVLGWAGMSLAAIPAIRFDPASAPAGWIGRLPFPAFFSDLPALRVPLFYAWSAISQWLDLYLLGVSAALGYAGIRWDAVRPVRPRHFIGSKLLGLLGFLIVPQLIVLETTFLLQGFTPAETGVALVRSGAFLFLLHVLSLLFGRLCGGFWPWLAGVSLIACAKVLFVALPIRGLPPFGVKPDVWASDPAAWWPVLATAVLMVPLLRLLRHRNPMLRLTLGALVVLVLPPLSEKIRPPIRLGALPALADWKGELKVTAKGQGIDPRGNHIALDTEGLPPDSDVMWFLEESHPLRDGGRRITQVDRRGEPASGGSQLPHHFSPPNFPLSPPPPALKEDDSSYGLGRLYVGPFDERELQSAGALTLDASVFGVIGRYEKVAELRFGESATIRDRGSRTVVRAIDTKIPQVRLSSLELPRRVGPTPAESYRVIVHLPGQGSSEEWRISPRVFPLLGELRRRSGEATPPEAMTTIDGEMPPMPDLSGATVSIYQLHYLGKVRRQVRGEGFRYWNPGGGWGAPALWTPGALVCERGFSNCGVPMPDPATCDRTEAGVWMQHVLRRHHRAAWAEPALAPFVRRFPDLFLRADASYRPPLADLLVAELPESAKADVIEALARETNPNLTEHLIPVMLRRGWLPDAREAVLRRFRTAEGLTPDLAAAVAFYEDRSTYPELVRRLRGDYDMRLYETIRHLPGIDGLLDDFMTQEGERLAALPSGEDDFSFRGRLTGPAAQGSRAAFARLWNETRQASDPASRRWFWRELSRATSVPDELGNDPKRWHAFLNDHDPGDFEYDPLGRFWHLPGDFP